MECRFSANEDDVRSDWLVPDPASPAVSRVRGIFAKIAKKGKTWGGEIRRKEYL